MSSPDASRSPRLALMLAIGLAGAAGGCLQPLYAENTRSITGSSVRSTFQAIEIAEIKGLTGHYLRNELVFELDGGAAPDASKTLKFNAAVSDSVQVVSVDFVAGKADSAVLVASANWTVTRADTGQVVASGSTLARAPYERSGQRFATVRAARDAQVRAAKSLATQIRGQLAAGLVAG